MSESTATTSSSACACAPETASTAAATSQVRYVAPRTDIYETREGYELSLDLPGVPKDGLELNVHNRQLTVTGHRVLSPEKAEALYREIRPASFRRTFELNHTIDTTRIAAKLENGVLRVQLPKTEAVKPRKIEVQAS